MESNFNNGAGSTPTATETPTESAEARATTVPAAEQPSSPGLLRFRSCRWQQPAEDGNAEFCTHREVKPYAGSATFDADAWCPDCAHYKLRRTPKKRQSNDFAY